MSESKLSAALRYASAGLPVFPCHTIKDGKCTCGNAYCKSPGKHPRTYDGLKGATTDDGQIAKWWSKWPDSNIAMSFTGTGLFALDIDRGDDRDGFLWLEAVESELPSAPTQITPSGGQHLIFRVPPRTEVRNSASDLARGVDIRGEGGYIMVAPSDHAAGSSYYWEDELTEFLDDIPVAPDWLIRQITGGLRFERGEGLKKWRISNELDAVKANEIASALEYVDPDGRDTWLQVGMAIHSEFANEDGFDLWCDWSSASAKFDARDQRYTWDKFDSYGGIGLPTIFALAMRNGWHNTAKTLSSYEEPDEELRVWEQPPEAREMPPHLIEHARVGVLADWIDWVVGTSYRPQPILALASGLTLFGTIFGRFFEGLGARTNLYTLGVATSGAGKDYARRCAKQILVAAQMEHLIGAEELASGSALYKEMTEGATRLFLFDEFGMTLARVGSAKASSFEREIVDALLKIYNGASDELVKGKAKVSAERVDLKQPHACVYGTSTPNFYDGLTEGLARGGLLSRFLVFDVPGDPPARNKERGDPVVPPKLVNALERFREWQIRQRDKSGNLGNLGFQDIKPTIVEICFDEDAKQIIFEQLDAEILDARKKSGDKFNEIWARAEEQTIKLAMIRRLCAWAGRDVNLIDLPTVTAEDVKWARDVVLWCVGRLVLECDDRISASMNEDAIKRVRKAVRSVSPEWISKSLLTRKTQRLTTKQRDEAISTLLEIGDLETSVTMGNKRSVTQYRATSPT